MICVDDLHRFAWLFAAAISIGCGNGSAGAPATATPASSGGSTDGTGGSATGEAGTTGAPGDGGSTGSASDGGTPGLDGGRSLDGAVGLDEGPLIAGGVRWVGRVDARDPTAVKFAWSGTGFVATIAGSTISVKLKTERSASNPPYFIPVIDGTPGMRFSVPDGEQTVTLGSGLSDGDHTVELYRETEGQFGDSIFEGVVDGTLRDPPPYGGRLIEIIGDSISAGYGNLGSEQHPGYGPDPNGGCHFTTETESAYQAYGSIAARALGAEASIVAISGWGVYRGNGGATYDTLPSVYSNTLGTQSIPPWGFGPKPQAVVINLGTNDFAQGDPGEAQFEGAYKALLATVRGSYPDAWIFCTIGPLPYGTGLSSAQVYLHTVVGDANASGDSKVKYLDYGQQDSSKGTGCDYHPNVAEDQNMSDVLVPALKAALGW